MFAVCGNAGTQPERVTEDRRVGECTNDGMPQFTCCTCVIIMHLKAVDVCLQRSVAGLLSLIG